MVMIRITKLILNYYFPLIIFSKIWIVLSARSSISGSMVAMAQSSQHDSTRPYLHLMRANLALLSCLTSGLSFCASRPSFLFGLVSATGTRLSAARTFRRSLLVRFTKACRALCLPTCAPEVPVERNLTFRYTCIKRLV